MTCFHLGLLTLHYPKGKTCPRTTEHVCSAVTVSLCHECAGKILLNSQIINTSPPNQRFLRWWRKAQLQYILHGSLYNVWKKDNRSKDTTHFPCSLYIYFLTFISNLPFLREYEIETLKCFGSNSTELFVCVWKSFLSSACSGPDCCYWTEKTLICSLYTLGTNIDSTGGEQKMYPP